MHILEDHQQGTSFSQRLDLRAECFKCLLSALLRGEFERGVASVVRQRQHFGKKHHILLRRGTLRQQGIEFVELGLRGVIMRKSSSPLQLADDGIEYAVGVLWGAEITQARVRLGC